MPAHLRVDALGIPCACISCYRYTFFAPYAIRKIQIQILPFPDKKKTPISCKVPRKKKLCYPIAILALFNVMTSLVFSLPPIGSLNEIETRADSVSDVCEAKMYKSGRSKPDRPAMIVEGKSDKKKNDKKKKTNPVNGNAMNKKRGLQDIAVVVFLGSWFMLVAVVSGKPNQASLSRIPAPPTRDLGSASPAERGTSPPLSPAL